MNKKLIYIPALIVLVILLVITINPDHFFSKLWDKYVLDNKNHYLTCEELPTDEEVGKVIEEHRDIVEKIIKEVSKRYRDVEVEPLWDGNDVRDEKDGSHVSFAWGWGGGCVGKGDITIWYPAHADRVIIEKIIEGDTFFGIPYNLKNI